MSTQMTKLLLRFSIDDKKGKVIHSQGISYDVDNINKEINIKQTSPKDWIFL